MAVHPCSQPRILKLYQPLKALCSPPRRIPGRGTAGTTAARRAGFCPRADASAVSGCLGTPWPPLLSLTPRTSWQQGLKLIPPPEKRHARKFLVSLKRTACSKKMLLVLCHHVCAWQRDACSSSNSNKPRNHRCNRISQLPSFS